MKEPQFLHTSNKGVNVKPINAALHRSKNEGRVVPPDIIFYISDIVYLLHRHCPAGGRGGDDWGWVQESVCVGLSVTYYVTKLTRIYISAENQDIDPKLSESVDWNILRWSMISNICLLQVMSPKLPMMKWFSQLISYPAKKQKNIDYISQEPSSKSPMITEWFSIRRLNIGMASNMLLLHFEQWWRDLNALWQHMLRKIYKHIAWGNGILRSPQSIYWPWYALLNAKCNTTTGHG